MVSIIMTYGFLKGDNMKKAFLLTKEQLQSIKQDYKCIDTGYSDDGKIVFLCLIDVGEDE